MRYCLNPTCTSPENDRDRETCQNCGATLQLHNRFVALRPIGQGGFGRTFLAADERDRRCVIKQFFPQQWSDPERISFAGRDRASELFRQEALRLKELGAHPQIPDLIAYLEQDGYQYLIQEFIDGDNLNQELEADGIYIEVELKQLLLNLLPVLQFMHDRQVIHRDIKPANIIRRRRDRRLVLVDMGAAKYATETALARTGTVIGSAEYVAPEQSRGKAVFASDIYSLGVTCIHLLTQMSPFDLYDSSEGKWVWRDYLRQPVSDRLAQILDKMLAEATRKRYQSAAEVLQDLAIEHSTAAIQTEPAKLGSSKLPPTYTRDEPDTPLTAQPHSHRPYWSSELPIDETDVEQERRLAEYEKRRSLPPWNAAASDPRLYPIALRQQELLAPLLDQEVDSDGQDSPQLQQNRSKNSPSVNDTFSLFSFGFFVFTILIMFRMFSLFFNQMLEVQPPIPPQPPTEMNSPRSNLQLLGSQWYEQEDGWTGYWTRRGDSNIFDAVWKKEGLVLTAVLTIELEGNSILIERRQSSDGNDCNYTAILPENGSREIQGRYQCNRVNQGDGTWRAQILR